MEQKEIFIVICMVLVCNLVLLLLYKWAKQRQGRKITTSPYDQKLQRDAQQLKARLLEAKTEIENDNQQVIDYFKQQRNRISEIRWSNELRLADAYKVFDYLYANLTEDIDIDMLVNSYGGSKYSVEGILVEFEVAGIAHTASLGLWSDKRYVALKID